MPHRLKKHNRKKSTAGFTLLEMLVTIFVFTILMGGVVPLFKTIFTTSTQQTLALNTADQARKVAFNFTDEIRNTAAGNDGAYPLNQAGDSQIIFYSSFGANGTAVNRIRYFVSNGTLYKGVVVPSGNPPAYNPASENVSRAINGLATTTPSGFYYYNDSYGGTSTPLTQPININLVKFVKLNLILLKQDTKNSSASFTVGAGATMRNLKTNLGN